jgi:hypothetical protein
LDCSKKYCFIDICIRDWIKEEELMLESIATRQIKVFFISTYKYRHSLTYAVVTFWKVFSSLALWKSN